MSTPGVPLAVTQVVARNIAPLAGIVFFGWSAQNALLLYFVDTLLALGVLFAGLLRHFAPPIEDDGWAARANTEVGRARDAGDARHRRRVRPAQRARVRGVVCRDIDLGGSRA